MGELSHQQGEDGAKVVPAAGGTRDARGVRRCKTCLGTVPPGRRKYCREWCAEQGKIKLQRWRRQKGRG